ncbi:MAG: phosphoribosylamine--glycine ligase [Rhodothermales bacterium]
MKVLVIGGGGREHAIAWKLSQSPAQPALFIAPGNPGTATLGKNIPIPVTEIAELLKFAQTEEIDLTIVGPEQPLVEGVVDAFQAAGLRIFGPNAAAAELEGSKAFAKAFMEKHNIPSAAHRTFTADQYDEAKAYINSQGAPIVLKANGLAAGKGVLICNTLDEAMEGLDALMKESRFGDAGTSVVIEAFMEGEEASVFALTDGEDYVLLAPAQDHKRIGDGDTGPNTGGMGAYAPAPIITAALMREVEETIIKPTLHGMKMEGRPYRGILYTGLMMTTEGPMVVEFNCRFGDPETQVVLPLLQGDLLEIVNTLVDRKGHELKNMTSSGAAACVVLASAGYPGSYPKGKEIKGIADAEADGQVVVFQAGTRSGQTGGIETSGGRVLGVTAFGDRLEDVLQKTYQAVERIDFEGSQYRRDIGKKGLSRLSAE